MSDFAASGDGSHILGDLNSQIMTGGRRQREGEKEAKKEAVTRARTERRDRIENREDNRERERERRARERDLRKKRARLISLHLIPSHPIIVSWQGTV